MIRDEDLLAPDTIEGVQSLNASIFKNTPIEDLPQKPKYASEALRLRLNERGKRDLYFLCKVILGYRDLNPQVHGPMCKFADQALYKRRMMLSPRGTLKTTIWTIGDSIKEVINNPEITILILAAAKLNAGRFAIELRQHFEKNDMFRWVYSEIVPDRDTTRWNANEVEAKRKSGKREPTFDVVGMGSHSESRHYDVIKADDIIDEEAIHSDAAMAAAIRISMGFESLLVSVAGSRIDLIGSHKKKGDVYDHQIKYYEANTSKIVNIGPFAKLHGDLAVFTRNVLDENGNSIWESRIPKKFLIRLRKTDPERYYAQYANSPKGSGLNIFTKEDLRYFVLDKDGTIWIDGGREMLNAWEMERIVVYDPAKAEKKGSSRNAILLLGKPPNGPRRFILERKVGHYLPDEAVDYLFDLEKRWRPTFYSIEHRGYQGSIKYWLNDICEIKNLPYLSVVEYPPEGSPTALWAKPERIKAMQPLTRHHLIYLQDDMLDLQEDFEFYPNVRFDDGLDALAQHLEYWPMLTSDEYELEQRRREDSHLFMQTGHSPMPARLVPQGTKFDEMAWLSQIDSTGYGLRKTFNH